MKGKLLLLIGAAAGYVAGTAAGRERFEQIKQAATRVKEDPRVREKAEQAAEMARERAEQAAEMAREKGAEVTDAAKAAAHRHGGHRDEGAGDVGDQLPPESLHFQSDPYPKGDLP